MDTHTVFTLVVLINGRTLLLVPHKKVTFPLVYCLEHFFLFLYITILLLFYMGLGV